MAVTVIVALRFGSDATAIISYLLLAAYALISRAAAIQALALSWLFTMLNPGLAPATGFIAEGRWLVMSSAFSSVIFRGGARAQGQIFWLTIALGMFLIIHAIMFSSMAYVSFFKALSWILTTSTLIAVWSGFNERQYARTEEWLFGFLVLVAIFSLPIYFIPEISYLRNERGFQGILSHPQSFGTTMALLGAFLVGRLLERKQPSWFFLGMTMVCLLCIYLSQARTAGLGLVLAVAMSVITVSLLSQYKRGEYPFIPALRSKRFLSIALFFSFLSIAALPQLYDVVGGFLLKGNRVGVDGILAAYENSRAVLYVPMLDNIYNNPISGIGFGVASDPSSMIIHRDPIFGVPVSAPVEKGISPLAVLEEIGIPGFILFGLWILILLQRAATNGITSFLGAMTVLLLNMGEATLFSPGGMGMLVLIVLAFSATKPRS